MTNYLLSLLLLLLFSFPVNLSRMMLKVLNTLYFFFLFAGLLFVKSKLITGTAFALSFGIQPMPIVLYLR